MSKRTTILVPLVLPLVLVLAACNSKPGKEAKDMTPPSKPVAPAPEPPMLATAVSPAPAPGTAVESPTAGTPAGSGTPATMTSPTTATAPTAAPWGIAECDEYQKTIARLDTCTAMSAAVKAGFQADYAASATAWAATKDAPADARTKQAASCKTATASVTGAAKAICGWK